jgi:anti-sigma28 factor (negative regulator of flagellin synthesis)
MSDINEIGRIRFPSKTLDRGEASVRDDGKHSPQTPASDHVELSDASQRLMILAERGDIRLEKVLAVRDAIHTGEYDTPTKLHIAVDRLFRETHG